jgi:phycobilisome rod-core linker protein
MPLSLLSYPLSSQNQRVTSFEIAGDEQPRIYDTENLPKGAEVDEIIHAAYQQVFNEQQMLASHRQVALESQLRAGQMTIREFMRGLVLSDSFRRLNYETNNNYRFVEMCIQRLLGRNVYGNREKLAWSTVLATKGLRGFVNALLESEEYMATFGDTTVPYQRRRILPQQWQGELPFARMARYDAYHLNQLRASGQLRSVAPVLVADRSAAVYRKVLLFVPAASVAMLVLTLVAVAAPK